MKKVLLACLLGLGTLATSTEAKSSMVVQHRIISITIEGWVFRANSDQSSGPIETIQIYNVLTGVLVRSQSCDSYSCSVSLTGLPFGLYVGNVITTNGTAKKSFSLG
jgi:hypothetical protein